VRVHDFDRDLAIQSSIKGGVNARHATCGNEMLQLVAAINELAR